jgi:hypothetical protein
MLRSTIALLVTIAFVHPATAADGAAPRQSAKRAAAKLPAGLPRAHYKYRTTIVYGAPTARFRGYVERYPDLLITPANGPGGYLENLPGTPILPGSATIPGYYGRAFDYNYQGPYYGGPYVGYWWRLPYACGVYGYC